MNNPIKEILEWIAEDDGIHDEWDCGWQGAKNCVSDMLAKYQQDPQWVCLEGMTAGELQAYDYGFQHCMDAVKAILDGKVPGGACQGPWKGLRERLVKLVAQDNYERGFDAGYDECCEIYDIREDC